MVKTEKFTMTKVFNRRKYPLDQIYWDKERAMREAAEARAHGYYSKVVPVMYEGELKYARYTVAVEMVRKKPRRK